MTRTATTRSSKTALVTYESFAEIVTEIGMRLLNAAEELVELLKLGALPARLTLTATKKL